MRPIPEFVMTASQTRLDAVLSFMRDRLRMDFVLLGDVVGYYIAKKSYSGPISIYLISRGNFDQFKDYLDYDEDSNTFEIEGMTVYISDHKPRKFREYNGIRIEEQAYTSKRVSSILDGLSTVRRK